MTDYKTECHKLKAWIGRLKTRIKQLKQMNNIKAGEIRFMRRQFTDITIRINKILSSGNLTKKDMDYIISKEEDK